MEKYSDTQRTGGLCQRIWRHRKAIDNDQRGIILVLFVLLFVPMLILLGFAIDIAANYVAREQVITAADAASLAGTSTGEMYANVVVERKYKPDWYCDTIYDSCCRKRCSGSGENRTCTCIPGEYQVMAYTGPNAAWSGLSGSEVDQGTLESARYSKWFEHWYVPIERAGDVQAIDPRDCEIKCNRGCKQRGTLNCRIANPHSSYIPENKRNHDSAFSHIKETYIVFNGAEGKANMLAHHNLEDSLVSDFKVNVTTFNDNPPPEGKGRVWTKQKEYAFVDVNIDFERETWFAHLFSGRDNRIKNQIRSQATVFYKPNITNWETKYHPGMSPADGSNSKYLRSPVPEESR